MFVVCANDSRIKIKLANPVWIFLDFVRSPVFGGTLSNTTRSRRFGYCGPAIKMNVCRRLAKKFRSILPSGVSLWFSAVHARNVGIAVFANIFLKARKPAAEAWLGHF